MARAPTYPPLDVLKPVAEDIWIVDAEHVNAGGLPLPLRMTVIRLANGDLLLHSPTPYRPALRDAIARHGPIRHLVAPNVGHWLFLRDWQRACGRATTWAVEGLRDRRQVRRAGLHVDVVLGDAAPPAWAGEIDQILVAGPAFEEVAFLHRASRTLILTDLVLNIEPDRLPLALRPVADALGILAPQGRAPAHVRLLLALDREGVARAAGRLVTFAPERVIFAHGLWFSYDAEARLRRSLDWALPPAMLRGLPARRTNWSGIGFAVLAGGVLAGAALAGAAVLARRRARPGDDA